MSMVNALAGSVLTQKPIFSPAATLVRVQYPSMSDWRYLAFASNLT